MIRTQCRLGEQRRRAYAALAGTFEELRDRASLRDVKAALAQALRRVRREAQKECGRR
jgi:hypothetical protein